MNKTGIIAGLLAAAAFVGFGGAASAAPVADTPELQIHSAGYPLEYRVLNVNGDGFSSTMEPNSVRDLEAEGFTTVEFFVNGKPVIGYAPLEADHTLVCNAGGTDAAPSVTCAFG
ncbi:hypothetical protein AB0L88_19265 [Saccharopolyspora shandongensis]|uniref:hypothetical protein n=1 Tax=Saccharopolyspora shandongensis TaxID=418495 RepID=UPI003445847A